MIGSGSTEETGEHRERTHLSGMPEVVERIEGHLQQLIGLAQPIPCPVVLRAQIHCPSICLCTARHKDML